MEPKKISFGFSKVIKKPSLFPTKLKEESGNKIELIKCVEGQSIKLINQEQNVDEKLLIIPMKDNCRTSAALASLKIRKEILNGEINENGQKQEANQEVEIEKQEDSVEQRAIRELLKEARGETEEETVTSNLTLPVKPDELPLEGATEPSLDDYESIPISQFGLAMLRGMGWKDEDKKKSSKHSDEPTLRPKGMGLGADKVLRPKELLIPPEANEKLEIKKNAYVRILGGKHKDLYGQIEGLDDHAGRVIVKLALGGTRESLNEFMVQPVSKREYAEYGKVINSAKYEEYKRMENEYGQIIIKTERDMKSENDEQNGNVKKEKYESNKREIDSRGSMDSSLSSSDDKYKTSERDRSTRDYKREESNRKHRVKKEFKQETTLRSSKHSPTNEKNRPRRRSAQRDESTSRRDHRGRRQDTSTESSDSEDQRKHKKKSKSKKNKDRNRYRHDSSDEDKRHKKKTKRSKRPRSRSRERR